MSFHNLQECGQPISIFEDGMFLTGNIGSLDFVNSGVSVTIIGDTAEINIPGGGGGGTIGGTITPPQVAFGIGPDTIGGDPAFIYNSGAQALSVPNVNTHFVNTTTGLPFANVNTFSIFNEFSVPVAIFSSGQLSLINNAGNHVLNWGVSSAVDNGGTVSIRWDSRELTSFLTTFIPLTTLSWNDFNNLEFGDVNFSQNGTLFRIADNASVVTILGNVNSGGTQGAGLDFNFLSGRYEIGDLSDLNNQTALKIDDSLSQLNVFGMKGISTIIAGFTGTGLDDLTFGGTYTGGISNNYLVWIDSFNNYTVTYLSETGPFTVGEIVDNGGGVTATVVSDDGAGNLLVTGMTGGVFVVTDVLTGATSGESTTVDTITQTADTFAWQDTLGNSGSGILIDLTDQLIGSFGITVTFGATTGHDIGVAPSPGPFGGWEEDITTSYGRMVSTDGQGHIITVGDVDSVQNGTQIIVDDDNKHVYTTNTFSESSGSDISASTDTHFGDGNKFNIKMSGATIQHFFNTNVREETDYTLISISAGIIKHNIASAGGKIRIMCPGALDFIVGVNTFFKVYYTKIYPSDGRPAFIIHDINY